MKIKRMEIRARVDAETNKYLMLVARNNRMSKNRLIEMIIDNYIKETVV